MTTAPAPHGVELSVDSLGVAVRHVRRARRLSQRGLAEELDLPRHRLAAWESGQLGRGLAELLETVRALGFTVLLVHARPCESVPRTPGDPQRGEACAAWADDGRVRHRDAAGRALPAHGEVETTQHPPLSWLFRRGWPWGRQSATIWHRVGSSAPRRPAATSVWADPWMSQEGSGGPGR